MEPSRPSCYPSSKTPPGYSNSLLHARSQGIRQKTEQTHEELPRKLFDQKETRKVILQPESVFQTQRTIMANPLMLTTAAATMQLVTVQPEEAEGSPLSKQQPVKFTYELMGEEETFMCLICQEICTGKDTIDAHMIIKHKRNTDSESVAGPSSEQQAVEFGYELVDKGFRCITCKKIVKVKQSIIRHVKAVHFEERLFSCLICGFKFKKKDTLQLHNTVRHTKNKPYKCHHCEEFFSNRKSRLQHARNNHEDKYSSACSKINPKTE